MSELFTIIIPVHNKWKLTKDCLNSLAKHSGSIPFKLIVIDNGSSDKTSTDLQSLGSSLFKDKFQAIQLTQNLNFGPACNLAAHRTSTPYLFFLNNDTLLTDGWSEPLINTMEEDYNTGAVGSLLLYPDDTVQHAGVAFYNNCLAHLYLNFPASHSVVHKDRKVQATTGAALMVRKELFDSLGGFFTEYVNGFEDVDFCLRLDRNGLGYDIKLAAESVIYHLESQTPGRHENDDANVNLLHKRCGKLHYIDIHHHALRDGFDTAFDLFGNIRMIASEENEKHISRQLENFNPEEIKDIITKNPLWLGGHLHLIKEFEKSEKYNFALYYALTGYEILPTKKLLDKILELTRRVKNQETKKIAMSFLEEQSLKFTRLPDRKETLTKIYRKALGDSDAYLADKAKAELEKES